MSRSSELKNRQAHIGELEEVCFIFTLTNRQLRAMGERKEPSQRLGIFTRFNVHNKQGSQPLLVFEVSRNMSRIGKIGQAPNLLKN